jgi:alpha-1,3-rhamnosyl/mannosyltransferase
MSMAPPISGIGHYTTRLSNNIVKHPAIDAVKYFDHWNVLDQKPEFSSSTKQKPIIKLIRKVATYPLIAPFATSYLHYQLSKKLNSLDSFLYHETNYILMPFKGKTISSIHDLSYIHYRDLHPKQRIKYFDKEMPKTIERANHFITDSQFIKNEIIEILGVADKLVTVIPIGVTEQFKPRNRNEILPILDKYNLSDKNYILLVGSIEPRKNLKHFLEAYTNLPESLKKHFKVIHVGPSGWLNTQIHNKIKQLENKGQFKALGYLPENELVCLYAGAYVFAFPSIYEGFGLPPLEAMASGIPVLASNISSIPEVVGDCGVLTDPFDVDKMSFDLERILTDNQLRPILIKKGLERAKQFSWDNCVNQTLEVYKQVIAL